MTVASGDVIDLFESNKNCHRISIARCRLKCLVTVWIGQEAAAQLRVEGRVWDFEKCVEEEDDEEEGDEEDDEEEDEGDEENEEGDEDEEEEDDEEEDEDEEEEDEEEEEEETKKETKKKKKKKNFYKRDVMGGLLGEARDVTILFYDRVPLAGSAVGGGWVDRNIATT